MRHSSLICEREEISRLEHWDSDYDISMVAIARVITRGMCFGCEVKEAQ